jgi:hypothetical protein
MSTLFNGDFEYEEESDFKEFLETIEPENALKLIDIALSHANKEGSFTLDESYCIYKCMDKLKKQQNENKI